MNREGSKKGDDSDPDGNDGRGNSSLCTNSAMGSAEPERDHATRVKEHRARQVVFEQQTKRLAAFMTNNQHRVVQTLETLAQEHDIEVTKAEDYTNVTQSNIPGLSSLLKAHRHSSPRTLMYVHLLKLKSLSAEYRTQLLDESLKILMYFAMTRSELASSQVTRSSSVKPAQYFVRVLEMFHLEPLHQVLVIEEKFSLENALQHRIWSTAWNTGYFKVSFGCLGNDCINALLTLTAASNG